MDFVICIFEVLVPGGYPLGAGGYPLAPDIENRSIWGVILGALGATLGHFGAQVHPLGHLKRPKV